MLIPRHNKTALTEYLAKHHLSPESDRGQVAAITRLKQEIDLFMPHGEYGGMFPPRWLPSAAAFITEPFSEQNRMVNSTMKIVRTVIVKHYQDTLDYLYSTEGKEFINERNKAVMRELANQ